MLISFILLMVAPVSYAIPADAMEFQRDVATKTFVISPVQMPENEAQRCLSSADFRAARLHDFYPLCNVDIPGHDIFPFLWVGQFENCLEFCDGFNSASEGGNEEAFSHIPMAPEVHQMKKRGEHIRCKAALFLPERFTGENDCYLKYALDGAIKTEGKTWIVGGVKRRDEEEGGITFNGTTSAATTTTGSSTMAWGNWTTIAGTGMTVLPITTSSSSTEAGHGTMTSSGESNTSESMNTTTFASSTSTTQDGKTTSQITIHNPWSSESLILPTLPSSTERPSSSAASLTIHNSWTSEDMTPPAIPTQTATEEQSTDSSILIHNSRSSSILSLPMRVYNHDH